MQELLEFIKEYHRHYEANLDEFGRSRFAFHGERANFVLTVKTNDAFVTFYLPRDRSPDNLVGYHFHDFSTRYDLNIFLQASHMNQLKFWKPELGKPFVPTDSLSCPNVPGPDELRHYVGLFFSDDIRAEAKGAGLSTLRGMLVTPSIHTSSKGIVEYFSPTRLVFYSPTQAVSSGRQVRVFHWSRMDIWWQPELLALSKDSAAVAAHNDFLAMQLILDGGRQLPSSMAAEEFSHKAASQLDAQCDEFNRLLESHPKDEAAIHAWLAKPAHHLFLDPDHLEVMNKVDLHNYVTDFVIKRSDGTYVLVELEAPSKPIFKKHPLAGDTTAEFNHARNQVANWKQYIREHLHHVREIQGLKGIYEPLGMIVIGRSGDFEHELSQRRWADMKANTERMVYLTYDELVTRIRTLAQNLRQTLSQTHL